MRKEKAKISDLENELPSMVFCYLHIEPHSVKQLAVKIYGKGKENFRKGITDWIQKFSNAGWIESKPSFTKEKFYQIKLNPFFEWVDSNNQFNDEEKKYLRFLIDEFLTGRIKKVGVHRNIINVFSETLQMAKTINQTHHMFGFDTRLDTVVKRANIVKRSGKFFIPSEIEILNKKMFNKTKIGKGYIDLTFLFASLLMPISLISKI